MVSNFFFFLSNKGMVPVQVTQEMWIQSLGWEDPLEEEMAIRFNILAWEIS